MILHKVIFGAVPPRKREEAVDALESYLSVMFHNGQAVGEYFHVMQDGKLCAYVHLAGVNALSVKYQSSYHSDRMAKLVAVFGQAPHWTVIDDDAPKRDTTWSKSPFLYLFTHFNTWKSPLCRGDSGKPIPLYRVPGSHEDREAIYYWQNTYRDYDSIWIGCGHLEIPVYRELASPDSELSQQGREICQQIETAIGIPTYYYLMRYWGRRNGEETRRCPGCGGSWHVTAPVRRANRFCDFPFRCDKCRLVSHLGDTLDQRRHAKIGEWKERQSD